MPFRSGPFAKATICVEFRWFLAFFPCFSFSCVKPKTALISVSDKTGVLNLSRSLQALGFRLLSTGGTCRHLTENGVEAVEISAYANFPEIMGGRVKTLHPAIHGGILMRSGHAGDAEEAEKRGIESIDLVVANLYPFSRVRDESDLAWSEALELIDVGGPCMIRAAAKNHERVAVLVDPAEYASAIDELKASGEIGLATRRKLAVKAFSLTARYDAAIHEVLSERFTGEPSRTLFLTGGRTLRYGENPHQRAQAFSLGEGGMLRGAKALCGQAMSYNNYLDADAALSTLLDLPDDRPAACVVKHGNPCGAACGTKPTEVLEDAWNGDPVSSFGGILAFNARFDLACARFLKGSEQKHVAYEWEKGRYVGKKQKRGKFAEMVLAPEFTEDAVEFLTAKSGTLRLVVFDPGSKDSSLRYRSISNGMLVQSPDLTLAEEPVHPTRKKLEARDRQLVDFGLATVKHAKSNAIAIVERRKESALRLLGLGAGQPNRLDALRKLACVKARENLTMELEAFFPPDRLEEAILARMGDCLLVSDAFFPFPDSLEPAFRAGIRKIVQPGGSKRDGEVVRVCDELGIAMCLTGTRHFNH